MRRLSQQFLDSLGLDKVNYYELQATYAGFHIPTTDEWKGGTPGVGPLLEAQQVLSNGILQAKTMQAMLGGMAANVGVPSTMFDQVKSVVGQDIGAMLEDALAQVIGMAIDAAKQLVQEALNTAMEALTVVMDLVSAIPLYGYLIELVWNLIKGIVGLVQILKAQKKAKKLAQIVEQGYPAYNPNVDMLFFNNALKTVRDTLDWTGIWKPPYLGISQTIPGATFGVADIEGAAWEIKGIADTATGSPGCTPGVGWAVQGVLISELPLEGIRMMDTGEVVMPSIRQQNGYLWKSLLQNNEQPGIYCIDADVLHGQWAEYVGRFWHYIANADFKQEWLAKIQEQYAGSTGTPGPFFGMNVWDKSPSDTAVENVLCVRECETLRERQWALLNTPLVAYLHPDMVALKPGSNMRNVWQERKQQLLGHPARCSLDLGAIEISDPVYHQKLIESGADSPGCGATQLATSDFKPESIPKGIPTVGGIAQNPQPPDTEEEESWFQRYGIYLLGAAVLGGAGYGAYRYYQRRPNGLYLPR